MEAQANKHRRDITFTQGYLVPLRLQPYRQKSVQGRTSQKLSKRFYGPFNILRHIGKVAYELDLPPSSKIHLVIHVSELRQYKGDDPEKHFVPIPSKLTNCITFRRKWKPLTKRDTMNRTKDMLVVRTRLKVKHRKDE